ncbi:MAG: hypothetical protein M1833_003223 [Piccolia ochrophora]|nr:MAG: hypothetical protein M1833_003223 [Piccolia ochrophora]
MLFGAADLSVVANVFGRVAQLPINSEKVMVYCDEDHVDWYPGTNTYRGQWYDRLNDEFFDLPSESDDRGDSHGLRYDEARTRPKPCENSEEADELNATGFMVICPDAFRPMRDTALLSSFTERDALTGRFIDRLRPLSVAFLHEASLVRIHGIADISDNDIPEWLHAFQWYGFRDCTEIASVGDTAKENSNNYAILGKALFLDAYDWTTGYAVPLPPPDVPGMASTGATSPPPLAVAWRPLAQSPSWSDTSDEDDDEGTFSPTGSSGGEEMEEGEEGEVESRIGWSVARRERGRGRR